MRRLAFAAAVCGTLVLAACSDQTQSPTEPAVPAPEQNLGSCVVVRFPLLTPDGVIEQIRDILPAGLLRLEAQARAAAVALFWDTCHPSAARQLAISLVNWIDRNFPDPTSDPVVTLKNTILNGVGITFDPPAVPGDFGIGFFDPNSRSRLVVVTTSGHALVELEPGSFNQPTTIIVNRKPDFSKPLNVDEDQQFPPFWDYDAINESQDHVLKNGQTALIVFCLYYSPWEDGETPGGVHEEDYPQNRRIGHNPVEGAPGFPFERLEPVTPTPQRLLDQLDCENTENPLVFSGSDLTIGGFGSGLPGLADAAWRAVGHYLAPVARTLFLPEALAAATLGTLPPKPINGKAPSLSDFGVVEALHLDFLGEGETDPGGESFVRNSILTWDSCGECTTYPAVTLTDQNGGVGNVPVTVSLVRVSGTGSFATGSTTSVVTSSGPYDTGLAEFTNLRITRAGTYKLTFSAPGAESVTSGEFTVTQN